jgi:asparagine synthetase B (glutamine-hydrolysing)
MASLAGWLTGEGVTEAAIKELLLRMGTILGLHGGEQALALQPGAGLIAFADPVEAGHERQETLLDWAPARRTLVYRRPLTGWHPLYYVQDWPAAGNLLFAGEIKALFAAGVPRRLFLPALAALLRYGFIPAPWTAFAGIQVVPAGGLLRWQQGHTLLHEAQDYSLQAPMAGREDQEALAAQLEVALVEACAALSPAGDGPLLALTDGTGAAALIAELVASQRQASLQIATISYRRGRHSSAAAATLAATLACPLLTITGVDAPEYWPATLSALEAPCVTSFPLALHQLLHTSAVESGAGAVLTGLGARLLLMEAPATFTDPLTADALLSRYHQALAAGEPQQADDERLWSPEAREALREAPRWEETRHAQRLLRKATDLQLPWQRWRYLDLHLRLPDLLVTPAQALASDDRLVLYAPFLQPGLSRQMARLSPATAAAETAGGHGWLARLRQLYRLHSPAGEALEAPTRSLCQRPGGKQRSGAADLLQATLSPEALRQRGIFDRQAVAALVGRARRAGEREARRRLLLVFTTQLLCQLFQASL